jgi:ssDNA thymidine ADP-ribosyltransferase, DarT
MSGSLTQKKAFVFRISHRDNAPWIMANGMHCRNSHIADPYFRSIGNPDLIDKRQFRNVPCSPFGTLSDYVPFYFTPFTPMLLNIKTGFNGIKQRPLDEIVIFVTSLRSLHAKGIPFVFTDRHAVLATTQFSSDLGMLDRIDWTILRNRDFKRDPEDPGKFERYQAEALVHRHLPMEAAIGVVCYNDAVKATMQREAEAHGHTLQVISKPGLFI